jgi:hypothetical protein
LGIPAVRPDIQVSSGYEHRVFGDLGEKDGVCRPDLRNG